MSGRLCWAHAMKAWGCRSRGAALAHGVAGHDKQVRLQTAAVGVEAAAAALQAAECRPCLWRPKNAANMTAGNKQCKAKEQAWCMGALGVGRRRGQCSMGCRPGGWRALERRGAGTVWLRSANVGSGGQPSKAVRPAAQAAALKRTRARCPAAPPSPTRSLQGMVTRGAQTEAVGRAAHPEGPPGSACCLHVHPAWLPAEAS